MSVALTRHDLGSNQILWKLKNTNAEHIYVELDIDSRSPMGIMRRRLVIEPGHDARIYAAVVPPEPDLKVVVSERDVD